MGRACGTYGGQESAYKVLVGILEGRRPLGRTRRRWEDNITIEPQEVGWDDIASQEGLCSMKLVS
jgi:hypothetical protein